MAALAKMAAAGAGDDINVAIMAISCEESVAGSSVKRRKPSASVIISGAAESMAKAANRKSTLESCQSAA
jgi:hypothetical protein